MSKFTITKDNVWQYSDKSQDDVIRAKCKYCESDLIYIELLKARDHVDDHKDNFIREMRKRMTETTDVYCLEKCDSCTNLIKLGDINSYCDHIISEHFTDLKNQEIKEHFSRYFKIDNFRIECKLCSDHFFVALSSLLRKHIKRCYADKSSTQKTYDVGSSKRIPLSYTITSEKDLWDNYTKLNLFGAKCKFCVFECHYMNIGYGSKFSEHLLEKHEEVSRYEAEHKTEEHRTKEELWRYFYYYSEDNVRCFICLKFQCPPELNYLNEHMEKHRSEKIDLNCFGTCAWILKYCIESKDTNNKTSIKCNLPNCNDKMDVEFNFGPFDEHYKSHQAGPSGETSSKKTKEGNSSKD